MMAGASPTKSLKTSIVQNEKSPNSQLLSSENKVDDEAERAFLELQDAKVNFFNEKSAYEDKMQ